MTKYGNIEYPKGFGLFHGVLSISIYDFEGFKVRGLERGHPVIAEFTPDRHFGLAAVKVGDVEYNFDIRRDEMLVKGKIETGMAYT